MVDFCGVLREACGETGCDDVFCDGLEHAGAGGWVVLTGLENAVLDRHIRKGKTWPCVDDAGVCRPAENLGCGWLASSGVRAVGNAGARGCSEGLQFADRLA